MQKKRAMDALLPAVQERDGLGQENGAERAPGTQVDHVQEASSLWSELHHLGNAGFDPQQFRIDPYGNVLYWSADPSSPLAWEVVHWSPLSGAGCNGFMGRNGRLVQWQVAQLKHQKVEFLMPWWDLQVGISVNQFLLIYASKNADFRKRAFSLLFPNDEADDAHRHIWPLCVKGRGDKEMLKENRNKEPGVALVWPYIERLALVDCDVNSLQLVQKKPSSHPVDASEMKDRILHELAEELVQSYTLLSSSIEQQNEGGRELRLEVEQKREQVLSMERELKRTRHRNERERMVLRELENTLEKQKQQLEKQRHWSQTQSRYRRCLERISRDTLHQTLIFTEQAKLTEAACDALVTKIQSLRMSCKKAGLDLIGQLKQRQDLELESAMYKGLIQAEESGNLERVMGIPDAVIDQNQTVGDDKVLLIDDACLDSSSWENDEEDCVNEGTMQMLASKRYPRAVEAQSRPSSTMWMDTIMEEEDESGETEDSEPESQRSPLKRKKVSDLDSSQWKAQVEAKTGPCSERIVSSSGDEKLCSSKCRNGGDSRKSSEEEKQLDELLQEVLTLKGQAYEESDDGDGAEAPQLAFESEEERKKRLGKLNVDKWLQRLLLSNGCDAAEIASQPGKDRFVDEKRQEISGSMQNEERSRKMLDGLLRMMNFRHDEKSCDDGIVKRRCEDSRGGEKKRKHRIKQSVDSQSQSQSQHQSQAQSRHQSQSQLQSRHQSQSQSQSQSQVQLQSQIQSQSQSQVQLQSQIQSQSQSQIQSHDHHQQQEQHQAKAEEGKLNVETFKSPSCSEKAVKRSHSMSCSTSDPWIQQHTSSSESTKNCSSAFEEGECVSDAAVFHDGYGGNNNKSIIGMGLRASLRTSCRKAWNRARSRREIRASNLAK